MLDICLLGTGGMMPLPYRWLTSMMARCEGSSLLIDCGEGTQIALKKKGWSPKPIDVICFTHYHADHISGLPGLLLTMGNAERTEPLLMIGPKGLERVVAALRCIAPELPFPIHFLELTEPREQHRIGPYLIDAYRVNHNVVCYGYAVTIPRTGKFDAERAKAQNIPLKFWNPLQKGKTVTDEGRIYTPDMVLGDARRGLKVSYCTDTRPVPVIAEYAKDADLMICEGMYGEPEKLKKAREHKHMTMYEAAELARQAQPKELWLTHYSPSLNYPEEYMDAVRKIFPAAKAARDGWTLELGFTD
ncbi:ribonuclease Z [Fusobacterium naviforme]|uniref:Ribonuclease Z n=1 Tax=Moryella indoligenes TaxID=371674 RepID=A0AAE4AKE2_9FIRM|nr:ribonuclease Z [Moryella indoligenes]KAB0576831.1 ribonuclease Z [Fusobacterium naviforme]MDQ0151332.1 ribonuclease Z [Moryella indoligenes]PSL09851.1 ribonuclease Z [Fusobacterium naviforme]STO27814.1 Ribonuclease Z [Fusobacterium naviforme]